MIAASVVENIKRLLSEGRLSQRKIALRLGVSRGTVNAIALGKRPDDSNRRKKSSDDFLPPTGPVARCRTCGALVQMPCLACQVRARIERRNPKRDTSRGRTLSQEIVRVRTPGDVARGSTPAANARAKRHGVFRYS